MRYKVEYDGNLYVLEAPRGMSAEELVAEIQAQKPEIQGRTFQMNPPDTPFEGKPPTYEPDVEVDLPNAPQANMDQPEDISFQPRDGTPLNLETETPTAPAIDANLGQADLGNRARAVLTGATASFGDELEAGVGELLRGDPALADRSFIDRYRERRDKVREDYGLYQSRNPVESAGLEIGGALTTAFIPGVGAAGRTFGALSRVNQLKNPLARVATIGGGAGAVSGAGAADEISDIPWEAVKTGIIGAAVSPLALLAGKGAGGASRWVTNRMSAAPLATAEEAAGDVLHAAIRRSGKTPTEIINRVAEGRRQGIPTMIGDELVDSADAALRVPSEGRAEHLQTLVDRQLAARDRTQKHLNKAFGNPEEFYATEEKLLDAGRRRAASAYDKAYAIGDVRDPRIIGILAGKNMRKFWSRAKEIADLDAEAAIARGEDPAPYQLKPLFTEVMDGAEHSPIVRTDAVPDVRTLDYIKKGMSDEIDGLYRGTSSAGKQQATGMKELYNAFVKRVDEVVPEYKEARKLYAGDLEVREALEAGRGITKLVPAQVRKLLKGASTGELDALRTGAYEGFRKLIDDPTTNRNWGKIFSMPGKLRDNLQAILPKKEFDLLRTVFDREGEIFATSGVRMAGSQTIGRKEAVDDIDRVIQDSDLVGTASSLATSTGRLRMVMDFLSNRMINPEKRDRVYTLLSKVYRAGEPDDIMEALELLNSTRATSVAALEASEAVTPRTAAALGSVVGADPVPGQATGAIGTDFAPIVDDEEGADVIPATEAGTDAALPFEIPPTGVPEVDAIVPRLLQQESGGNPTAESPVGAYGLMQIMPETQRKPGFGLEPLKDGSAKENLRLGTQYLAALYRNYGSDMTLALMAYNWGPNHVDAWLQGGKKSAVPEETKNYVHAILGTEIP